LKVVQVNPNFPWCQHGLPQWTSLLQLLHLDVEHPVLNSHELILKHELPLLNPHCDSDLVLEQQEFHLLALHCYKGLVLEQKLPPVNGKHNQQLS
jgi:hypothetical protein